MANTEGNLEANRIIREFERRAKEAEAKERGLIPTKTNRLIEKFEKKAQGIDEKCGPNGTGPLITNMRKMFEPVEADEGAEDKPAKVICPGSTNKLIERFQEPGQEQPL
ncbi:hypothetical protein RDWZM_000539 [Blomia tropicalis]|uniref:Uncharacterized protein n=1 Tax=Blomia tropicalis TaxID=40697 RepID=A0A9Q0RPP2_BLOTA|nr:hypothetical protein BLOT_012187 [Blomia tropicalis]KAJ6221994.1 hypothetical protein RDWZM_000539 [Blomia tropicalis]